MRCYGPGFPPAPGPAGFHSHPYFFPLPTFEPFIANPGHWSPEPSGEPACPDPQARDLRFDLDHSPLPPAFDPFAYPKEKLFACVLVGTSGKPLAVRLIGVSSPGVAKQLAATIHEGWSFSQSWEAGEMPTWVRVRLNRGPMEAVMTDYARE